MEEKQEKIKKKNGLNIFLTVIYNYKYIPLFQLLTEVEFQMANLYKNLYQLVSFVEAALFLTFCDQVPYVPLQKKPKIDKIRILF